MELKAKLSEALEQIEDTEMEVEQAEQERVREKHRADEANRRAEATRGRGNMAKRRAATGACQFGHGLGGFKNHFHSFSGFALYGA